MTVVIPSPEQLIQVAIDFVFFIDEECNKQVKVRSASINKRAFGLENFEESNCYRNIGTPRSQNQ